LRYVLSAANKTDLPIDGNVDVHLVIHGHEVTTNVSVSPAVDELQLGSNWLDETSPKGPCRPIGPIRDQLVHEQQPVQVDACWRVFVSEEVTVPLQHEANVPVCLMVDDIRAHLVTGCRATDRVTCSYCCPDPPEQQRQGDCRTGMQLFRYSTRVLN